MNEEKIKEELLAAGATEEDIAKLERIIDSSKNADELCKALKEAYPDFKEAEFKRGIEKNAKESEDTEDLSDEALASVAGGSIGSWVKDHKTALLAVAALASIPVICHFTSRTASAMSGLNEAAAKQDKILGGMEGPKTSGEVQRVLSSGGKNLKDVMIDMRFNTAPVMN